MRGIILFLLLLSLIGGKFSSATNLDVGELMKKCGKPDWSTRYRDVDLAGVRRLVNQHGPEAVVKAKDIDYNDYACLHHAAAAAEGGDLTWFLLDIGADPDAESRTGAAPLSWAAWGNRLTAAEHLLTFGADASRDGSYALFLAVNSNLYNTPRLRGVNTIVSDDNIRIVRLLLQHGADPHGMEVYRGGRGPFGETTPFRWAVHFAQEENVREMAKWSSSPPTTPRCGWQVEESFRDRLNAIIEAIERGKAERQIAQAKNDCDPNPCPKNVKCEQLAVGNVVEGFKCRCPTPYEGPTCRENLDDCARLCSPFADCSGDRGSRRCQCKSGYLGGGYGPDGCEDESSIKDSKYILM